MKTITAQLENLFKTAQYQMANLYQFNLVQGGSLYYCSGDADIYLSAADSGGDAFWADQLFLCGKLTGGPFFDRKDNKAQLHQKIGLDVDTVNFDVIPGKAQVEGISFLQAVKEGIFDGAEVIYLGAYWPSQLYASRIIPTGTIKKMVGGVADVGVTRDLITFAINSRLELLNQNLPRNLYQATCLNTLYDTSCALIKSSFQTAATVTTGSTAGVIYANLSQATGYFNLGTITFTSGLNSGISRTIKTATQGSPGVVTLIAGFPSTPSPGDTFYIYPGCDKTMQSCINKFKNLSNFRGFPFLPQQENAG